jgi:hypothetical protein
MNNRDRTCRILEDTLRDAINNLEQAKECMTGWNWSYLSPEEIDQVIATLRKIVGKVERETS